MVLVRNGMVDLVVEALVVVVGVRMEEVVAEVVVPVALAHCLTSGLMTTVCTQTQGCCDSPHDRAKFLDKPF